MLTGELRSQIDAIWNSFWSGGISNPLEVMEQITYLLFLRRLDDLHTLEENKSVRLGKPMERRIFPQGADAKGRDFNDLRGWAILAKGDLLALQSYLREFEDTTSPKNVSLQPPFKKELPGRFIASLAYLRGHLHEKQQRPELALLDYHSAMTFNNGSDRMVFATASLAALKITAAQAAAKPGDAALQKAARSLAVTYRDIAGQGKLPAEFAPLLAAPPPEPAPASAPAAK